MRDFDVIAGRRWLHIAEWLGSREDGQRTARWSYDTKTGILVMSDGWKRPGHTRLNAEQVAYVRSMVDLPAAPS